MSQQTGAHGRLRGVQQRIKRGAGFPTQGEVYLEVTPRGCIQLNVSTALLHRQGIDVRQGGALGVLDVVEQGTRGADSRMQVRATKAV